MGLRDGQQLLGVLRGQQVDLGFQEADLVAALLGLLLLLGDELVDLRVQVLVLQNDLLHDEQVQLALGRLRRSGTRRCKLWRALWRSSEKFRPTGSRTPGT